MPQKSSTHDVTCVVNAHKESHLIFPTLTSVKRAADYAEQCGIQVQIQVILDSSDEHTIGIVRRDLPESGIATEVQYGDLADSRNQAASISKGRYTAFIDADDLWGKSWIADAFIMAERDAREVIFHPEFNIYFGNSTSHVLRHVDMDSPEFVADYLYQNNYWTALSFARTSTYQRFPYTKNTIRDGFGYEDWTWNFETVAQGVIHKVVPSNCHFIRRGKAEPSLLDLTNTSGSIPRIYNLYKHSRELNNLKAVA